MFLLLLSLILTSFILLFRLFLFNTTSLFLFESVCSLFICYPSFYPLCFLNQFWSFFIFWSHFVLSFVLFFSVCFSAVLFFCCFIWPLYDELIRYFQTCLNGVCWAFNWTSSSSYSPRLKTPHKANRGAGSCTFFFPFFFFFSFSEFILSSLQDSEKYVEQLLTLFNRFSRLVKEAFQDDPRFLTARDKVSPLWVVL